MPLASASVSRPQISICTCLSSETVIHQLTQILEGDRYELVQTTHPRDFFEAIERQRHWIDCLILEDRPELHGIIRHLHREATLLPVVLLGLPPTGTVQLGDQASQSSQQASSDAVYHSAEVYLSRTELGQIAQQVDQAIAQFLKLSTACKWPAPTWVESIETEPRLQQSLTTQQQRLSEKLKERLGYLGVYYKRNANLFLRNLPHEEKEELLNELKSDYREIVLNYFNSEGSSNRKIDEFVTKIFFTDISISKVLEIHMELMDIFAKKLRLEGRSEDILLDYRLTLIDTIAHLCEFYRRSIPRDS